MPHSDKKQNAQLESSSIKKIEEKLKSVLTDKRYKHSIGTKDEAIKLAKKYGADPEKAAIAGLLHDSAKYMNKEEMIKFILDNKIQIPADNLHATATLHAFASEYIAYRDYHIEDKEILNAIRYHTVGNTNMSTLEKVVFIADKIEPNIRKGEPFDTMREILKKTDSLDQTLLFSYGQTIIKLIYEHSYVNLDTVSNWNHLVSQIETPYLKNN